MGRVCEVRYRRIGGLLWRRLRRVRLWSTKITATVVGDRQVAAVQDVRVFELEDGSRVEIPALTHEFRFSPEAAEIERALAAEKAAEVKEEPSRGKRRR